MGAMVRPPLHREKVLMSGLQKAGDLGHIYRMEHLKNWVLYQYNGPHIIMHMAYH